MTGNVVWATDNEQRVTGNEQWATSNGQPAGGNGEWGTEPRVLHLSKRDNR
ncbi:hypothetical protein [Paenibacillus phoenicis]|uniref:hypothetical protein n=1 Tax=Paenibacillus phoenicis TaxID=554117 RepID=UPI003D26C9A7